MTAHVVFSAIDAAAPVTLSRNMVEDVIRGQIGFDGILISDDLSMKALSGPMGTRCQNAFLAGCDLALHCNGDMVEMAAVAQESPDLSEDMAIKLAASLGAVGAPQEFDPAQAVGELKGYLENMGESSS
jgi:beta-N-acetylhexosaminidase